MYFKERNYLYTSVGLIFIGVQTSEKGATGAPSGVLVRVRRAFNKGSTEGASIGGGY